VNIEIPKVLITIATVLVKKGALAVIVGGLQEIAY